ncbi:MAG: hypothetical protein HQK84_08300 [Nitrospinae bacterium]|nr:hypothetical protein [Nitrospinota bacterium]
MSEEENTEETKEVKNVTAQQSTHHEESSDIAAPALATTAGIIGGGVATSGAAMGVAGAGASGIAGYATGISITAHAVACAEAAAIGTMSAIAAGPILGGLIGYTGYKVFKSVMAKK